MAKRRAKAKKSFDWSDPIFLLNKAINAVIFILIGFGIIFLGLFLFGIRPYVVLSGSMEPEIKTGSVVFVNQNVKFAELKQGDVITFKTGDVMVTHRVHEIIDGKIITKGDANNAPDGGYVTAATLVGKNVRTAPKLGYLVNFLQSLQGKIVAGAIILLLAIGSILTGRDDEKEESD